MLLFFFVLFKTPPSLLSANYGPNKYSEKILFWPKIENAIGRFYGSWLLLGDYNGVISDE